jgi:hypothetical protein
LFKVINEEGVWQDLLRRKYVKDGAITQIQKKAEGFSFLEWLYES